MYRITIRKQALKEISDLPKSASTKIVTAINLLADEPRPTGCKKLKGNHNSLWRIRVGNYRVLYAIDDIISVVEVSGVGHRKDIYD